MSSAASQAHVWEGEIAASVVDTGPYPPGLVHWFQTRPQRIGPVGLSPLRAELLRLGYDSRERLAALSAVAEQKRHGEVRPRRESITAAGVESSERERRLAALVALRKKHEDFSVTTDDVARFHEEQREIEDRPR